MFPELIELLLIGCSIELILIQRSKSNTSTPRTNLQTSWQRGISHVMNGIICWPCLISAILALLLASQRWQNELNKNQEKDVSQPNHDLWWIWPQERLRSCLLQPYQTRWGPRMDIKILENLFQVTIERGNPLKRQDQTIHRIMVHPGLLKCGKVEMESTIDQGNLKKFLGFTEKSWPSSWGTSSRQDGAFCKERRVYSR